MNKNISQTISDAELKVLQVLWVQSPLPAQSIIDKLEKDKPAHPRTVKTLINRLLKKGAISYQESERKYHYFPKIDKAEFYQHKTEDFLEQYFNGEVTPLLTFFSQNKKMDENDLKKLKQLVEQMEKDGGD